MRSTHVPVVCLVMAAVLGAGAPAEGWPGATGTSGSPPRIVVWKNDGPLPLPVGEEVPVGSMHLPQGSWAVFAKLGVIVTQSTGNNGKIRCRLVAGADADRSAHTLYDPSATDSRLVLGLEIAHRFSAPGGGTARLTCRATVEDVEASFVRLAAIRAGRLTTIALGSGTSTTTGQGSPIVVAARRRGAVPVPSGAFGSMATIHLSHGGWAIFAKLDVDRSSGTSPSVLNCRLAAGGDFDQVELGVGSAPPPPDRPIPLMGMVHTFDDQQGGPVELRCRRSGAPLEASFIRLTAIKAGRLTNDPIGPAAATTTGSGVPRIVSGYLNGPEPVPASDQFSRIARLHVTGGSWLVLAKAYVGRDRGTGEDFVDCRLFAGGDRDEVNLYLNDRQDVAFHLHHAFPPEGGVVTMACRSLHGNGGNDVRFVRITAVRAGTLTVAN